MLAKLGGIQNGCGGGVLFSSEVLVRLAGFEQPDFGKISQSSRSSSGLQNGRTFSTATVIGSSLSGTSSHSPRSWLAVGSSRCSSQ